MRWLSRKWTETLQFRISERRVLSTANSISWAAVRPLCPPPPRAGPQGSAARPETDPGPLPGSVLTRATQVGHDAITAPLLLSVMPPVAAPSQGLVLRRTAPSAARQLNRVTHPARRLTSNVPAVPGWVPLQGGPKPPLPTFSRDSREGPASGSGAAASTSSSTRSGGSAHASRRRPCRSRRASSAGRP